jgi:hypothetical protein
MQDSATLTSWCRTKQSGEGTFCPSPTLVFYIPPCRKAFPEFSGDFPCEKKKSVSREGVLIRSYTPRPRLLCMRAQKYNILKPPLENCSSGNGKAPRWCRNILPLPMYSEVEDCKTPAWARDKLFIHGRGFQYFIHQRL